MTETQPTYRDCFAAGTDALTYDTEQYGPRAYASALWRIEQRQLGSLLAEFRRSHPRIDYLDFACGTGRVLAFVEGQVERATGIEISEAMAQVARCRVQRARVRCEDITNPWARPEGRYDFITAFRFVLNAEPALREAGLRALAARLRDRSSWLVFNNHGYLWSHKALLWPAHALLGRREARAGNYLTHGQVRALAARCGLRIERVLGCGVVGAKLARFFPFESVAAAEARLAGTPLARFGVNQMYVARLA